MMEDDAVTSTIPNVEHDMEVISSCSSSVTDDHSSIHVDPVKVEGATGSTTIPLHPDDMINSHFQLPQPPPPPPQRGMQPSSSPPSTPLNNNSININATTPKSRHTRERRRSQRVLNSTEGSTKSINDNNSYTTINQRLVEYFCVVTSVPQCRQQHQQSTLNLLPSQQPNQTTQQSPSIPHQKESNDVEASCNLNCYPSAADIINDGNIHMPQQHHHGNTVAQSPDGRMTFVPTISARYPEADYNDNPFNPMILHFCFPFFGSNGGTEEGGGNSSTNDVLIHGTAEYTLPRVHHFVLTLGCGHKMYGTCLTVMEEYEEESNEQQSELINLSSNISDLEIHRTLTTESIRKKRPNLSKSHQTIYVPKVLCLLSTWPYLTAFREYLSQLYRLAVMTDCMTAPLERYIVNVCCEIPAPPPGAYEIQVPILDSTIRFWAPPAKLPIAYTALPYHILFECLDIDHIILVWTALVVERKVLLVSRQYSVLTVCAEILCSLLFPLRWSHLYVPMLPRMLCPMLDAPVPYLCGIVRENWSYAQHFVGQGSETTYVVDLDRNTVELYGGDQNPLPPIPPRKELKLRASLLASVGDVFWRARGMEDAYAKEMLNKPSKRNWKALRLLVTQSDCPQWEEKLSTMDFAFNLAYTPESPNLVDPLSTSHDEQSQWDRVQEGFLRFFVAFLSNYRSYLSIPEKNSIKPPSFDQIGFMASCRVDNVAMMTQFCQTQHYHDFLARRMYSPGEPDLVFFDQSIDAKLNRSKMKLKKVETPFLHAAKVHKDLTKLPAVTPNEEHLPLRSADGRKIPYEYRKIPEKFDTSLFCTPRPIPKMISAEFDRQAILVSRLRANVYPTEQLLYDACNNSFDDQEVVKFYKGDYDPSPEVASFMVFLFVYSSLVGQDWQKYSQKRRSEDAVNPTIMDVQGGALDAPASTNETLMLSERADLSSNDVEVNETCCGADCAESGVTIVASTMSYIGTSMEEFYSSHFKKPVDEVYASLSMHEDKNMMIIPESDDAAAEYEEAREVTAAQLEVAFETLATMALRGLSVDSDAYFSLMEACGRCGDTKRALKLIELMKKDGFVADSEVLSCFISAFAHKDFRRQGSTTKRESQIENGSNELDAYSRYLEKGLESAQGEKHTWHQRNSNNEPTSSDPVSPAPLIDNVSDEESDWSSNKSVESSSMKEWMPLQKLRHRKKVKRKHKHRHRNGITLVDGMVPPVTEMIARHLGLGENLLDFVYPDLVIDTDSDSCPHCSHVLNESNIVDGWKPCAFQDYTTACPKCQHRFVPRFVVMCSSPIFVGSQGTQTPLYCEFLSPWVLRKEFHYIIKEQNEFDGESGIDKILNPAWRSGTDICSTLFWNLIVCCRRYRLPYTFLLQGNFHNRLILPRKPDEI